MCYTAFTVDLTEPAGSRRTSKAPNREKTDEDDGKNRSPAGGERSTEADEDSITSPLKPKPIQVEQPNEDADSTVEVCLVVLNLDVGFL